VYSFYNKYNPTRSSRIDSSYSGNNIHLPSPLQGHKFTPYDNLRAMSSWRAARSGISVTSEYLVHNFETSWVWCFSAIAQQTCLMLVKYCNKPTHSTSRADFAQNLTHIAGVNGIMRLILVINTNLHPVFCTLSKLLLIIGQIFASDRSVSH